jgi:hypothetical protein
MNQKEKAKEKWNSAAGINGADYYAFPLKLVYNL